MLQHFTLVNIKGNTILVRSWRLKERKLGQIGFPPPKLENYTLLQLWVNLRLMFEELAGETGIELGLKHLHNI